ncbi:hypothetical protein [Paenibacillus sp. Soil750]|uniref:hypothetical protein n=1 Tax=Paenibacillus sp. Soil750 TaxID=1736398 RepID=UPI0006FFB4F1|nr:hypothetical protein [Paenibacillus sp. Soil750]KRE70764.1 hypothetical protein ASL11_10745 [Paenibacillus sp. Soil750]
MQYSAEEKETTCVYDYIDNNWIVYSCVPKHMTKLRKIAQPFWEEKDGDRVSAAKWRLNGNQIRFVMETKLTDEQRVAKREQARRSFQQSN